MTFNLDDFRRQLLRMRELGSIQDFMRRVPGLIPGAAELQEGEAAIGRVLAIIDGMTPEERLDPRIIDVPRRLRIARAAAVPPEAVSTLLRQYEALAAVVSRLTGSARLDRGRPLAGPAVRDAVALRERRRADRHRAPVAVGRVRVEGELSLAERLELRRRWELSARKGLDLPGQNPWYSNWNKNLRLWDFTAET